MKPLELLINGLKELGVPSDEGTARAFMLYLPELKRWNKAYNLTSITEDGDIVVKHFLDSLLFLPALEPLGNSLRVADIGSGAGFPGIPVKIIRPSIRMALVEPTGKKAAFLKHIINKLELKEIEVIEKRAEELAGAGFDAVLVRALYKLKDIIRKTAPTVRTGGLIITSKGPAVKEELKGLEADYEIKAARLPFSDIERYIISIRI